MDKSQHEIHSELRKGLRWTFCKGQYDGLFSPRSFLQLKWSLPAIESKCSGGTKRP